VPGLLLPVPEGGPARRGRVGRRCGEEPAAPGAAEAVWGLMVMMKGRKKREREKREEGEKKEKGTSHQVVSFLSVFLFHLLFPRLVRRESGNRRISESTCWGGGGRGYREIERKKTMSSDRGDFSFIFPLSRRTSAGESSLPRARSHSQASLALAPFFSLSLSPLRRDGAVKPRARLFVHL
jgi:hypothetical protein